MTERILRRTRAVARGALRAEPTNLSDINSRLQSIADIRKNMLEELEQVTALEKEVEELMAKGKIQEHEAFGLVAQFVEVKSNSSTEIDPAVLRKQLKTDKDFFSCVKVQMTAVKQFLSEREIAAIAKITPGKVTGTKFQVIQPKTKVGKGK